MMLHYSCLKPWDESIFPKKCHCGAEYNSLKEYIESTHSLPDNKSGFFKDEGMAYILLCRNCPCRNTLTLRVIECRS